MHVTFPLCVRLTPGRKSDLFKTETEFNPPVKSVREQREFAIELYRSKKQTVTYGLFLIS